MADSFFGFNTSLRHGLDLVDEPELDEEEEYDALNDETFGDEAFQGDWEEDHTRFAEVTENSRTYRHSYNSDKEDDLDLEASLSQLVVESEEEGEDEGISGNTRQKTSKPLNIFNKFTFGLGDYTSSPAWSPNSSDKNKDHSMVLQLMPSTIPRPSATQFLPPQLPRIPTVQELERDLMQRNAQNKLPNKSKDVSNTFSPNKNNFQTASNNLSDKNSSINNRLQNLNVQPQNAHGKFQQLVGSNKFPPGFGPPQPGHFAQPQKQEMVMMRNNQNMPLGLLFLTPQHMPMFPSPHILPPSMPPHPVLMQQNRMMKPHPMMRFMPSHPLLMQQQQLQLHQKQQLSQHQQMQNKSQNNQDNLKNGQLPRNHQNSNHSQHPWLYNPNRRGHGDFDEYAGLMNNRERQWLLSIQIIQLATDKPHVDDYYYLAWSKKREKEKKLKEETRNGLKKEPPVVREAYFPNNRQPKVEANQRERRDSERETTVTPSPRVYVPQQFENSLGKLQCGSVTAPRKIIDLDVVPERQVQSTSSTSHKDSRKAKKILLELEMLYLLAMNIEDLDNKLIPESAETSDEAPMSKPKLLNQILTSYVNEDRFVNFMCIRKGKTLLLRILSHLNQTDHGEHLNNLWCRFFKSISVIIRRDQSDGILLQMYPYIKQWIDTVDCTVLSVISSYLLIPSRAQNQAKKSSRAVSPNPGKSVFFYMLTTKFGVSAVSSILSRGEAIYPTLGEKEKRDWTDFVSNFIMHTTLIPIVENIPSPFDPLPEEVITVILNRNSGLHIHGYASAKRVLAALNKEKS